VIHRLALSALAVVIVVNTLGTAQPMENHSKLLKEALAHAKQFEATSDAEQLRQAYQTLENVSLPQEPGQARNALRVDCLSLWLQLLALLDDRLDPQFDQNDTPDLKVQPPETSNGTLHPPGADPALIDDPIARAAYEKAIRDNNAKIAAYTLQVQLHRLNERVASRAKAFIRNAYTFAPSDREEVKAHVIKIIKLQARQAELLKEAY
jgi:hypothetical protein